MNHVFGRLRRWLSLFALFAVCTMADAQVQRVPNTTLAMPTAPPTFGFTFSNAFPGLSFTDPDEIVSPPGETNRLFIVGKSGIIYVITNLAAPTESIFMNIASRVTFTSGNSGDDGEQGLLSMAFDPGYATNKFFYVFYTGQATNGMGANTSGVITNALHHFLSRFKILTSNTNQGDTTSETPLYVQYKRFSNHNGGDILFGPDGYLYVSVGDEGMEHDVYTNAQHITWRLWSGILRLDVDKIDPLGLPPNVNSDLGQIFSKTTNYNIPHDNPFVGATTFDGQAINASHVQTEFWATGLRNPWRMSFDPATSNLFCGDVGQDKIEEADIITKGGNYGWAWWEGLSSPPSGVSTTILNATPVPVNPINPFVTYTHGSATNQGNAIIGGVVYRGSNLPQLFGNYVFGDYVDGNIWAIPAAQAVSLTQTNGSITPPMPIFNAGGSSVSAFGVDPRNGDVLFTSMSDSSIRRIIFNSTTVGSPLPPTLADTGAFTNLFSLTSPQDVLQTTSGILPYNINVPFWSDNAIKSRWFSVPNTNLTVTFNPNGNWSFPTGTVWIKNFNLELTNGDVTSQIRLETRLLVKNSSGVYGVVYRWGGSKTNATLVSAAGLDENFVINDGGILRTQVWHYPSQQECQTCHTPAGGFGLGFRTEQLNGDFDYGFGLTNELQALSAAGYFSSPVTNDVHTLLALAAATNASASLEFRSRSFLMANCSQCHQPGGTAQQSTWDARITTPTALAGLINGPLVNNLGNANNHVVTPLVPTNSILLTRDATRDLGANPSLQMPPLDSNLVDSEATNLVTQWILSLTNTFWIGAFPDPQTITPGSSAVYSVTNLATSDFTGSVVFSVSGLPPGADGNFIPATLTGSGSTTLAVNTAISTPVGNYLLTISGIGGGQTNTDTVTLIVSSNNASPGTLIWSSGSAADTNWSDAINWTNITVGGNGPPGPANNLVFTNTAAVNSPGTINNVVDGNFAVSSLQFNNNALNTSPNYQVTLINSGQTLLVTNGIIVSTAADSGASQVVNAIITGANGTLTLSNGVVAVTQGSGTDGAHQAVLDLSGLGALNIANATRLAIAVNGVPAQTGNGGQRCSGVLYLARTNFIFVTSTGVTNGILVGWNDSQGNGNSSGIANASDKGSALYLGQTNAIFTDAIYVGTDKSLGCLLAFNPNGLNNPVAYFRGIGGAASRISLWGIGDTSMKVNSNQSASGTNDFTGGTIDALVGNLNVGVSETGASSSNTGNGTGTLTFNAGTIDVNNLTNGWSVGSGTNISDVGTGTINVNGSATLKVNNFFALAQNTGAGTGIPSGTLNVNDGTVIANNIVVDSGVSTITLNNAVLIVTNKAGAPASAISTFAATNSTLHLNLNGAAVVTNIVVANLLAGGVNTIVIDSVKNVGGITSFPLIAYSTFTGTVAANFAKGALPPGFAAYLVNNSAQKRIDLAIAPSATVTPQIGVFSFSGSNLIFNGSNGFPGDNYFVLGSTNVALPLTNWLRVSTNPFDGSGNFIFTNPFDPGSLQMFYLLQLP